MTVQNYPVRSSHRAHLVPAELARLLAAYFDSVVTEGDSVSGSFGAISQIAVRPQGRELSVEVTMNPKVPEDVARETIARYNRFLEETTGFSAKERAKRLRKAAGASPSGE